MPEEQNSNLESMPKPKSNLKLVSLRLSPYYYNLLEKFMQQFNIKSKSQAIRKMMEDGAKANNIRQDQ